MRYLTLILVILLAACSSDDTPPAPTGILGPGDTVMTALPEAPVWSEPQDPITLETVNSIRYLGRLDATGTPSTIFEHAFSPDGTQMAALNNQKFLLWDMVGGELIAENTRQDVARLFYSPDKLAVYGLTLDGRALIFSTSTGRVRDTLRIHPGFSGTAVYDDLAGLLAVGGMNGEIKVWDMLERRSLVTLNAHEREVTALAFSADVETLASSSLDGTVKIWNWRNRTLIHELDTESRRAIQLAFAPDGSRIAVGFESYIGIYSLDDGAFLYALQTGQGGVSDVMMYSPDGRYLLNGGLIPDMIVWDAESGDLVALLPRVGGDRVSAAFSPDGTMLLASVLDGPVTLWDMTSMTAETVVRADLSVGTDRVLRLDWSPDSYVMTFFDATGSIHVWGV